MQFTFKQAKSVLPSFFDQRISVELQSSPGLGKSDVIQQLITELSARDGFEWGYAELFLATQTPPDLLGYMMPETRSIDGADVRVSSWTMPAWMMTKDGKPVSSYRRGILFLDEYGQGEADVKRASAQLLLKGELGPWQLPEGWAVVAASNRSEDRSGVTKSFDFVINRRAQIEIMPDLESWNEWAVTSGVSPLTITFANQHPEIVFSGKVPEKQGPWCTPRSLVMADKMLMSMSSNGQLPTDSIAQSVVTSLIGAAAARQFFVFVQLENELPRFEKIIADPDGIKVPERPDAQMLVCYNLAHRITPDTVDPVVAYMNRFPKEFGITFVKSATARDYKLINTPAFKKWCSENASLMAALR